MPDEINPKVLILRHQRIYEAHRLAPKSAEQVFAQNAQDVDTSAQNLIGHLNRLQVDRKNNSLSEPMLE